MSGVIRRGKAIRADLALWDGKNNTATRTDATGGTITGLPIGDRVDVLQLFGNGTDRTYSTLKAAVNHIGSSIACLSLSPGTWTISTSLTIPSNVSLFVPSGCTISVNAGITLTVNGPTLNDAPAFTSGAGTVVFAGGVLGPYISAAETAVGVTPTNYAYDELDPRRYASSSDWTSVFNQIDTLAESYPSWYRGDRAQHPTLSNYIAGFQAYNDVGKTGTVGYRTTAIGVLALSRNDESVTAGGSSTAIGYAALENAVESSGNTAVGGFSLNSCTGVNSSHNNGFGYRSWPSLVDGTQNNGFGFQVGDALVTGNNNHVFGENTLSHLVVGYGNHSFGYQANYTKISGDFSHAIGYQALFSENAAVITAITKAAAAVVTISTVSTVNPFSAGQSVVFEGCGGMTEINGQIGLVSSVSGSSGAWTITVAINSSGFSTYTSGGHISPIGNTAMGYRAGFNVLMRGNNTIIGYDACQVGEPGYGNTVVGFQAGNTINTNAGGDRGDLNSVFGYWAGLALTSGASNAIFGQRAAVNQTTGSENIAIGPNSGYGITSASRNVSVGSATAINLNGANNTSVGYNAGSVGSAQTYTNVTSLGANSVPNGSNQVNLGDGGVATIRAQVTTITAYSDKRLKKEIRKLADMLPNGAVEDLPIAVFQWIAQGKPPGDHMGVIAQELAEWEDKWDLQWMGLVKRHEHDMWEADPHKLLFPLIIAYQGLSSRVAALEQR